MQAKAKIFLSDDRGLNETDWYRSRNSFVFGNYRDENKRPFGNIYLLNDDTLAGNRSISMLIEENTKAIILPLVGAVNYVDSQRNNNTVEAGQALLTSLIPGTLTKVTNPFQEDPVNFLQVWMRNEQQGESTAAELITYGDVNNQLNKSVRIACTTADVSMPYAISICKFKGRGDCTYDPAFEKPGIFLFVLEGAFEAAGCLLHPRDGLAIWDTGKIEIKALSNDASILLIEQSLNNAG